MILKLEAIFLILFLSVLFSLSIAATQGRVKVERHPNNNYADQSKDTQKDIDRVILYISSKSPKELEEILKLGKTNKERNLYYIHPMERNLAGTFAANIDRLNRMMFGYDMTHKLVKFYGVGDYHRPNTERLCRLIESNDLQNYIQVMNYKNEEWCIKRFPAKVDSRYLRPVYNPGQGPSNRGSILQNPRPQNVDSRPKVALPPVYPWTKRYPGQGPSNRGSILQNPRPQNVDSRPQVALPIIDNARNSGQGPSNRGSIPQNPNPPNGGSRFISFGKFPEIPKQIGRKP